MKNILITGGAGYIGSVLSRILLRSGYNVTVVDQLFFGGESVLGLLSNINYTFIKGDIRDAELMQNVLKDIDSVVHLAAIVGDPACSKQPDLSRDINWEGTRNFFNLCNQTSNIKQFIFASTCSNYGKMDGDVLLDENSPLKPVSLYAELKVKFEKYLLESKTRVDFIPTALRFATVYGLSPRMRFDLTVNEFIREVTFGNELQIFGEQFWRPYCHVYDLANACKLILESNTSLIDHNVYNVGDTKENYQKKMIAEEIIKIVPEARIKYVQKNEDPRDYRVSFEKINKELNFKVTKRVSDGLLEIYKILKDNFLIEPFNNKYKNI